MATQKYEDNSYKYKQKTDTDKGRVTHEKIGKTGETHEHQWEEAKGSLNEKDKKIKWGWRGENYEDEKKKEEDERKKEK